MVMQEHDLDRFGSLDRIIPYVMCVVCLYWIELVWRGFLFALIYLGEQGYRVVLLQEY